MAKKMAMDQIIGTLPSLSRGDLEAIQALVKGLLNDAPNGPQAASGPQAWLCEALQGALGLPYQPQPPKAAHGTPFLTFVKDTFPKAKSKVEVLSVMQTLLSLIISDLAQRQIIVTINTLIVNLPRIAEIFDHAFPGYRVSGLTNLVMRSASRQAPQKEGKQG